MQVSTIPNTSLHIPPNFHVRLMNKIGYTVAYRKISTILILLLFGTIILNYIITFNAGIVSRYSFIHLHRLLESLTLFSPYTMLIVFIMSIFLSGLCIHIVKDIYCSRKARIFPYKATSPYSLITRISSLLLLVLIIELISVATCIGALGIQASAHSNPFNSLYGYATELQNEVKHHVSVGAR